MKCMVQWRHIFEQFCRQKTLFQSFHTLWSDLNNNMTQFDLSTRATAAVSWFVVFASRASWAACATSTRACRAFKDSNSTTICDRPTLNWEQPVESFGSVCLLQWSWLHLGFDQHRQTNCGAFQDVSWSFPKSCKQIFLCWQSHCRISECWVTRFSSCASQSDGTNGSKGLTLFSLRSFGRLNVTLDDKNQKWVFTVFVVWQKKCTRLKVTDLLGCFKMTSRNLEWANSERGKWESSR